MSLKSMEAHMIEALSPARDGAWVLALNRIHEEVLSPLDPAGLEALAGDAFAALIAPPEQGFVIALDQSARYRSPNFLWFQERLERFVYVDRIVVGEAGRGVAAALYDELARQASKAGQERLVCEVNLVPPNPASDRFHERQGFAEVGRARLVNGKTVRYLERRLRP
jgi:predicted GNAT superfamily acetyltransferase